MADDLEDLQPAGIAPEQHDLTRGLEGTGQNYGIKAPAAPSLRRLTPPTSLTPAPTPTAAPGGPATPNLAEAAMSKWDEIKKAIHAATVKGLGGWLTGAGDPLKLFNPFLPFRAPGPGNIYSPERYKGIGAMGQRLRLIEDEGSAPMVSLRQAAQQNPLIQQSRIKVADLPSGAAGSINFADPRSPEITLAPIIDKDVDPGLVATHEIVGHGSHGPVGWRAGDQADFEGVIRPQAEGTATGFERGIYGKLAPASPYDWRYQENEEYRRARALGESLAQHIAKTGRVPHWAAVQSMIFGRPPGTPKPKPEAPGPLVNQERLTPLGTLPPALIGRPKPEAPWGQGAQNTQPRPSSPGGALRPLGIRPKPKDSYESWGDMLGGMWD